MINDIKDFYPTPKELTYKLLNLLPKQELYKIKYILEPSAGKGDLILNFKQYYEDNSYRSKDFDSRFKIDVIEINEDLNKLLRGKGCNVVWDDFLTFNPPRFYDLILSNVPFSNGVHHVLKQISLQERVGGKILTITNAETIKNPYSKERIELVQKLKEYNSTIQYEQNAFSEAERQTDVEVALIYIDIPMKNKETMFEREFKREHVEMKNQSFNTLMPKMNKLQQLLFEYNICKESIIKLHEERLRVENLFNGLGIETQLGITESKNLSSPPLSVNEHIAKITLNYWNKFIKETEFKSKLPSDLRNNFTYNMEKQEDIPFTIENIRYFYEELMKSIPQSYEKTVANVFNKLTREHCYTESAYNSNILHFNGWKSNCCYMIKPKGKVIVPFYNEYFYRMPDVLVDLNIIFNNISGRNENIDTEEVRNKIKNYEKEIKTFHFTFYSYKKGTIHIKFNNEEHLKQFNLIANIGNNALPPNFSTKKYSDMTEEEKQWINKLGFTVNEYINLTENNTYIPLQLN